MTPYLARIEIFPIKALDGVSVSQATVLASGALQGDRAYALFDADHHFINGKRNALIHRLRTTFTDDGQSVCCTGDGHPPTPYFSLTDDRPALEAWLGEYFQQRVSLQENRDLGFPDDTSSPGPTIVSTATLQTVAAWYPGLTVEDVRRRFRTNLEIDGVPAFWEDQLFSHDSQPVRFAIGEVELEGINPCQRCVVPTRDALTGAATPDFQKTFATQRAATLPEWTHPARFNHFYRLAVNTKILAQGGCVLRVGDAVQRLS
ncbi:MAG: MOSC domain-containing protein [Leptolyngbyaceae cyanobacterium SM2_5_2]|nr:MOSC domain-containing protein [Leptolyngbyaceae cyanobacterium SM2_5_2]